MKLDGVTLFSPGSRCMSVFLLLHRNHAQRTNSEARDHRGTFEELSFQPLWSAVGGRDVERRPPITEELLAGAADLEFGTQELRSLQLLERRSSGAGGYYAKIAEVELGADSMSQINRAETRGDGVVVLDQREGQHEERS